MQICFYIAKYGTSLDKLISAVSFSKYSHCELLFSDGLCASASIRDNSVRFKRINLNSGHWDIFDFKNITKTESEIRYVVELLKDEKYDYLGAVASALYLDFGNENKKYCSEICGYPAVAPGNLTPGALYRYLKKNNKI